MVLFGGSEMAQNNRCTVLWLIHLSISIPVLAHLMLVLHYAECPTAAAVFFVGVAPFFFFVMSAVML